MTKRPIPDSEMIEIIQSGQHENTRWTPSVGPETLALLEHLKLPEQNKTTLQNEAVSVLSRCIPPSISSGQDTGLVIGYVQSGKTMSFTTVAALARDNGYRLIIVITGTTVNLFKQSSDRLQRDLRIPRADRKWQFFSNPKAKPEIRQRISVALESDESMVASESKRS